MLSKEESLKIWEEVKANHKSLRECVGPHDFKPTPTERYKDRPPELCDRFTCTKCSGHLDRSAHFWYTNGLEHGRKEAKG